MINKLLTEKTSVFIHAVNFAEVQYKSEQLLGHKKTTKILADLRTPFIGIMHYLDADLMFYAANLKANYHLSLGDAIGLANTKIMKGTFWTADQALKPIAIKEEISIVSIR